MECDRLGRAPSQRTARQSQRGNIQPRVSTKQADKAIRAVSGLRSQAVGPKLSCQVSARSQGIVPSSMSAPELPAPGASSNRHTLQPRHALAQNQACPGGNRVDQAGRK